MTEENLREFIENKLNELIEDLASEFQVEVHLGTSDEQALDKLTLALKSILLDEGVCDLSEEEGEDIISYEDMDKFSSEDFE